MGQKIFEGDASAQTVIECLNNSIFICLSYGSREGKDFVLVIKCHLSILSFCYSKSLGNMAHHCHSVTSPEMRRNQLQIGPHVGRESSCCLASVSGRVRHSKSSSHLLYSVVVPSTAHCPPLILQYLKEVFSDLQYVNSLTLIGHFEKHSHVNPIDCLMLC